MLAELAVIRLGQQNRGGGGGGGTRGAVGNCGDRQDWQRSNTHNPNHISLPLQLHIHPHYRGPLHAYKRAALYLLHP